MATTLATSVVGLTSISVGVVLLVKARGREDATAVQCAPLPNGIACMGRF